LGIFCVPLSEILGQLDGCPDVLTLSGLVATRQQNNEVTTSRCIVDAVAGPKVDLELAYAARKRAMLSGIAVNKSIDANLVFEREPSDLSAR
jgi:hypothetical protein